MICSVVFKENGKPYNFSSNEINCSLEDKVIVETEKGLQYGKIIKIYENKIEERDLKNIVRLATDEDHNKYLKNTKDAMMALEKAKELVKELNLEMAFLDAYYTFDKRQLLFNFISDNRVDFRELAKRLAGIYKTRIELRQIGARDKAKEIGGMGQCGREICCSSFLNRIDAVTINMAKNQNIALNPNKINGACGRLLCCLVYEDEEYTICQKGLPEINNKYKKDGIEGIVKNVDILNRIITVDTGSEIKSIQLENCCHEKK